MSKVAKRIKRGYRRAETSKSLKEWAWEMRKKGDKDAEQWLHNKRVSY